MPRKKAKKKARKRKAKTSREDLREARRRARALENEKRWRHYHAIPQKDWREMSGRQRKTLVEQAALYGIPFAGRTIDLELVARKLHDFLGENAAKLRALEKSAGDPSMAEYRKERATMKRLEREQLEGKLVDLVELRPLLVTLVAILRGPLEQLEREYGREAYRLLEDALDRFDTEVDRRFSQNGNGK